MSSNSIEVNGIDEIGLTGAAAAVTNAVFHVAGNGNRIGDLSVTIDKVLAAVTRK